MQQVETVTSESTIHPRLSWSAIFAGWFMAMGMAGLLTLGGLALGYSAFDAGDDATTIGTGIACWVVLTWIAALFAGGMFASWFDGKDDHTMGAMHGITVWALFASTSGLMLALGGGHAMQGSLMHASSLPANRMAMAGGDPVAIARLERETARARMMMAAGEPASRNSGAPPMTIQAAADRVAHRMAVIAGVMFVASLLGLLASAAGGWLGANHIHRVYHLRRYARSPLAPPSR